MSVADGSSAAVGDNVYGLRAPSDGGSTTVGVNAYGLRANQVYGLRATQVNVSQVHAPQVHVSQDHVSQVNASHVNVSQVTNANEVSFSQATSQVDASQATAFNDNDSFFSQDEEAYVIIDIGDDSMTNIFEAHEVNQLPIEPMEIDNNNEAILMGAMIEASQINVNNLIPNEEMQIAADVEETYEQYCRRKHIKGNKTLKKEWQRQQQKKEERLNENQKRREERQRAQESETTEQRKRRLQEANELQQMRVENETRSTKRARLEREKVAQNSNRVNESVEERQRRLDADRTQHSIARENENENERDERLTSQRILQASLRDEETLEQTEERLDAQRILQASLRDNENEEEREQRLEADRIQHNNARGNENEEGREQRLEADRIQHNNARGNENEEERVGRLEGMRQNNRRRQENPEMEFRGANPQNVDIFSLGDMNVECSFCKAMHFAAEPRSNDGTFDSCCNKGKVKVAIEPNFPEELKKLLKREEGTDWKELHSNINKYNTSISFAYTVGQVRQLPGVFNYRVHGEVMHKLPRYTETMQGQNPAYGQLWIIETDDAIEYRCQAPFAIGSDREMFRFLHDLISNVNQYAEIYRMLHEYEDEERERAEEEGRQPKVCKIVFKKTTNNTSDPHAFPRANEVAAIYVCDENGDIPWNDVFVQRKCNPNERPMEQRIRRHTEHVEPLTFVLFNPYGTGDFWHFNKVKNSDNPVGAKMTALQYALFKLAWRPEHDDEPFNPILHGGKLLSKYLCWSFSIVDNGRMQFHRTHQRQYRVESYAGLTDYLRTMAEANGVQPGKKFILPSSYTMGPRSQSEFMHDAMAMSQKFGLPDLFITMTCNPENPDITRNLFENQKAYDRPDLVDIVFNYQVKGFVKEMKDKLMGKVKAYIYVVEFQKRGLPHIHSLWWTEEGWDDPDKINKYISAELPNENEDKELYDLVVKHMTHRPCGEYDPNAMCMQDGKCKRGFPKAFCDETFLDENSYPRYRRKNDGKTATIRFKGQPFVIDNRSVVPYNAYLLKRFQCHINIEIVGSPRTVNYLFKYLFKGPDKMAIEIREGEINYDEIKAFIDARYLSAHEAFWRLRKFDMHFLSESVERLAIHLPEQQAITMADDATEEQMLQAALRDSKLMAFFKLNEEFSAGMNRTLTYPQVCVHFTWKPQLRKWTPRCKTTKPKCPRMYAVNPKNTELFHLRKLLMVVKGPRNYEDLRRDPFDLEVIHPTFREACVARGLVQSDQMYYDALEEGTYHNMPRQLRSLFARIVAHCDVEAPLWLWNQFRTQLTEDLLRSNRGDRDLAEVLAWRQTLRMIINNERSLEDYPILQMVAEIVGGIEDESIDVAAHRIRGDEMRGSLNPEQANAYEAIMGRVENPDNSAACFYIDGPGGSGKTYLFNCLFSTLIGKGKKIIVMAWSGIAASLYETGRTVHNVFNLDFPFEDDSNSGISALNSLAKDLKDVDAMVWDETPMAPRRALEVIDEKLREIMNNNVPFGGKVMILGGDFRQLGPIVKNGTRNDIVRSSIKSSPLWQHFASNYSTLIRNERADNSGDGFAETILSIGDGSANDENGKVPIPEECTTEDNLVEKVFADVIADKDYDAFSSRAILSTVNCEVDAYNEAIINLLDENTEKVYTAVDRVENINGDGNAMEYVPEHFESFKPSGFPAYNLRLRENTIVMLMRNLNIREGLCNGTRLLIKKLERNIIIAEKLFNRSTNNEDNIVMIPRITLLDDSSIFTVYRNQFPVRPAFAMTINKAQGQTFDQIGVDISRGIFTHGHVYVAISRTRAWDRLQIKLHADDENCSRNIVYSELLNDNPLAVMPPDGPTIEDLNPNWNAQEIMEVDEHPHNDIEYENEDNEVLRGINAGLPAEEEYNEDGNNVNEFEQNQEEFNAFWEENHQGDDEED